MYKVPKDLMNYDKKNIESILLCINRFQWLDSYTFRIVNQEGYEKIVDFTNGFEEKAFNVIP